MSPLRIIILAILFYIGYRLIVGGKKKQNVAQAGSADSSSATTDILEEDPICKKLVPRRQAVRYEYQGKTHYFCSKKCCKEYKRNQGEQK